MKSFISSGVNLVLSNLPKYTFAVLILLLSKSLSAILQMISPFIASTEFSSESNILENIDSAFLYSPASR